jgi:exonuclease VII large subunit
VTDPVSLPQPNPGSDWTTETLRQHVLGLIAAHEMRSYERLKDMDLRYQQRFDAQQQALDAALQAVKEATKADLDAAKEAVNKAEKANERRFDAVNEFRAQLADQAASFLTRREAEARFDALMEKLEALSSEHRRDLVTIREMADRLAAASDTRLKVLESSGANLQGRLWALGAGIAFIVVFVNIAIRFLG